MKVILSICAVTWVALASAQSAPGICSWQQPRAGVVRDSLYIEGGIQLQGPWQGTTWGTCSEPPHTNGTLYRLNFSRAFDINNDKLQPQLESVSESNGIDSYYVGGTLMTDNDEFYAYGGMAYPIVSKNGPGRDMFHASLYQPNALATKFGFGITEYTVPNTASAYVTNGAGVSIPSESLSFYFSGMSSPNDSAIAFFGSNSTNTSPTTVVTTMLKVDTSSQDNAAWTESQIPSNVIPRAEAAMVWIPVGSKGSLFVIGGAAEPADLNSYALTASQKADSDDQNPFFMTQIPVYDIANNAWYVQQTTGSSPPALAQSCAVVAAAPDNSSYQIHVYGGYDGTGESAASDDVWILSVPAFRWIRATVGNSTHGRYSHVCATPYPDQMIVVGGTSQYSGLLQSPTVVDVFDLNTLTWTSKYDPTKWSPYKVPAVVSAAIGGNANGGANTYASGMDTNLMAVFKTPYSGVMTNFYPYAPSAHHKTWVVPVIASVVSVVGVAILAGLLWCFCRPAARKRRNDARSQSTTSRGRVMGWLRGPAPDPLPPKSLVSETTEVGDQTSPRPNTYEADSYFKPAAAEMDTPTSPGSRLQSNTTSPAMSPGSNISVEAGGNPRHELAGHLHGTQSPHNHPFYPPSILSHNQSQKSHTLSSGSGKQALPLHYRHARSPTVSDASSPYELPQNHSNEDIPRQDLNQPATPQTPPQAPSRPMSIPLSQNPPTAVTSSGMTQIPLTHDIVTSLSRSPSGERPHHERNKSSLSSGISAETSPTNPREDPLRSEPMVSSLARHSEHYSQEGGSTPTSPARPAITREIPAGWNALPTRQTSAYQENSSSRRSGS